MSMTEAWIYHIVAAVLAVLMCLSIVFQKLEDTFSVHKQRTAAQVEKIVNEAGEELAPDETASFLSGFNALVYMGRNNRYTVDYENGVTLYLRSSDVIQMVKGEKFYEVKRRKKNGKNIYYWLYAKNSA